MSTVTEDSMPDFPEDASRGSSVSSGFVNEYEEILKNAIVAPKLVIPENIYNNFQTITTSVDESSTKEEEPSTLTNSSSSTENKISEAKAALKTSKTSSSSSKKLRFNIPQTSALESLLEYSDTPKKPALHEEVDSPAESPERSPEREDVDQDLLRMDSLMDDWCLQLKRNVLSELSDMKRNEFQHQQSQIQEMKQQYKLEMMQVTHENGSMKEMLYSFEQNIKQKDEVIQNLTQALNKQKERSDKIRLFSMWRLKHLEEHRQQFTTKMADKYRERIVMQRVWAGWRGLVEFKWKQRVEKACQIKSQEVCIKLTEDYEQRLQSLQRELNCAREEVARMHTEREMYEETMKKAFMRGVCALNMEAMTMFRPEDENQQPQQHQPQQQHSQTFQESQHQQTTCQQHHQQPQQQTTFQQQQTSFIQQQQQQQQNSSPSSRQERRVLQPHNENKRVTFDTKPGKTLHVKMTAKKTSTKPTNKIPARSNATISSVKVERHVDKRTSPTFSNVDKRTSQTFSNVKIVN